MKISIFSTFQKEQFPRKLFAEIRYLEKFRGFYVDFFDLYQAHDEWNQKPCNLRPCSIIIISKTEGRLGNINFNTKQFSAIYLFLAEGFQQDGTVQLFVTKGQKCLYYPETMGQAQNLVMGWNRPGQPVKIWDGTQDGTITIFLSKSGTGRGTGQSVFFLPIISCFRNTFSCFRTYFFCFRTSFSVLKCPFLF